MFNIKRASYYVVNASAKPSDLEKSFHSHYENSINSHIIHSQAQYQAGVESLLQAAALLDEAGLTSMADQISHVLSKLSWQVPSSDPATTGLTSDQMEKNLEEKGWVFNADDGEILEVVELDAEDEVPTLDKEGDIQITASSDDLYFDSFNQEQNILNKLSNLMHKLSVDDLSDILFVSIKNKMKSIIKYFKDSTDSKVKEAVVIWTNSGSPVIEYFKDDEDKDVRKAVAKWAGEHAKSDVLAHLSDDEDSDVRKTVAFWAGKNKDEELLNKLAQDADEDVKSTALVWLHFR